jgi:hypothetical protein
VSRAVTDNDFTVMAGLDPAIHVLGNCAKKDVDARAFAAPKGLRPRRRVKPGHDKTKSNFAP